MSNCWTVIATFVAISLVAACGEAEDAKADLVLKNVTVFNSKTLSTTHGQSIFVDNGIIADIRPMSPADDAAKVIEGNGRLVAPGLIDTHIHFSHHFFTTRRLQPEDRDRLGRVFLTHGVTTIAEMGQPPSWVPAMTAWEDAPQADSPNLAVVAGGLCSAHDWDTRPPPHHVILNSPDEAKAQVKAYHDQGAERIKLYWKLEIPEMKGAVEEADRLGMRYYGHIDNGFVLIPQAMDEGVRHFEHFFTLQRSIEDPDRLIEIIAQEFPFEGPRSLDEWTLSLALYHDAVERTPELKAKFDALIDRLIEEDATVSTSINMLAAAAGVSPVFSRFDPSPSRVAPVIREEFLPDGVGAEALATVLSQVRRAHDAGLTLRIGTDARNGGEVLLAEMVLLADAGIPISEVLQIATYNGAEALGISESAGIIEKGRPADLVVFDKNPYETPDNFLEGVTTIKSGVVYEPTPSPADSLAEKLRSDGLKAGSAWWSQQSGLILHPAEFHDAIHRLVNSGLVPEARFMIDLLPQMLHGEEVTNYVHENELNQAGYNYLQLGEVETAIQIFRLAADLYPDSWNAYDSLGEAYATAGQNDAAIESYKRSVLLNPESESGRAALEKLQK